MTTDEPYNVSTFEAARQAGISHDTITRWANDGLIRCRKTLGGHRRFRQSDITAFIENHLTAGRTE